MAITLPLVAPSASPNYRLRLPGPTAVPERVRAATALPILSHRGPEFRIILDEVITLMRGIIGTTQDVFLFGASGTGGMEAALINVLSAGDAVLVVENGQFGERFSSIAEGLPVQLDRLQLPWARCPMLPR
jgi:aspartate aminotransferase-like enzyme